MDIVEFIQVALSKITGTADNANLRHFWVYVAAGMLIAVFAHRIGGDDRKFHTVFFNKQVWGSRSALIDYCILVVNPILAVYCIDLIVSKLWAIAPMISSGLQALGVGASTGEGSFLVAVSLTATLYLVNDFMRWWLHYLQHKVPVLWEFHKIHHSAEHLNFATAERHHPLDAVFFSCGVITAAAIVNGFFFGFFGNQLTVYQVSGANIVFFGSNLIGGVLRHSPAWVSYGPKIERWLISPAMHQIHHSSDPKHWDKNMGGGLAIWDRLGGTLYVPEGREELEFGIGPETKDYRSLYGVYILPLLKAKACLRRTFAPHESTWSDSK